MFSYYNHQTILELSSVVNNAYFGDIRALQPDICISNSIKGNEGETYFTNSQSYNGSEKRHANIEESYTWKPINIFINENSIPKDDNTDSSEYNAKKLRLQKRSHFRWSYWFEELVKFSKVYGHCCVPNNYHNQQLLKWVKRQRYSYSHKKQEHQSRSTLTPQRIKILESIGFVWNIHETTWQKRFQELVIYKKVFGHCKVPTKFSSNYKLAIWVKCQRRQQKLKLEGRYSSMTNERFKLLGRIGFEWEVQSNNLSDSTTTP